MKKFLVVATVLVALVALFSFSASAADVSLDSTATINADGTSVTLDKIAVNLDGDVTLPDGGYYTALAQAGDNIVFAAQETSPITGFNIAPTALNSGALSVKFGGTGVTTANSDTATFNFAFVALNADGQALALQPYGAGNTYAPTVEGTIHSFYVFGAELMDANGATAAGKDVTLDVADGETQFAIRSFRTLVNVAE